MKNYLYLITPFFTWLVAGTLKFAINNIKAKKIVFNLVGYGGFPSNHSAIVTSMATLIYLKNGVNSPAFGVAVTLAFIVILDAKSLRRQIGYHAFHINKILKNDPTHQLLRDRIGHSPIEIFFGICIGFMVPYFILQLI
jgi:acid phosphatase family membrane protein YuiD